MIPKIIWTYWDQSDQVTDWPISYQTCHASWIQHLVPERGWSINILSHETLGQYLGPEMIPRRFDELTVKRRSDCVRLALLKKYGGIWLDVGIFLQRDLEWVIEAGARGKKYVGYYLKAYSDTGDDSVVESWFMASSPNTYTIRKWFRTFKRVFDEYDETDLRDCTIFKETDVQKIGNRHYLFIHTVYQHLLQTDPVFKERHERDSLLLCAEDTAFKIHTHFSWNVAFINAYLAMFLVSKRSSQSPPVPLLFPEQPLFKMTANDVLLLNFNNLNGEALRTVVKTSGDLLRYLGNRLNIFALE